MDDCPVDHRGLTAICGPHCGIRHGDRCLPGCELPSHVGHCPCSELCHGRSAEPSPTSTATSGPATVAVSPPQTPDQARPVANGRRRLRGALRDLWG